MAIHNRFVVISFGPRGLTGTPNEKWFYTLPDAENAVRQRIGVRRLRRFPRVAARSYPGDKTWSRDGSEWRSIGVIEYRNVPRSHPDFEQSGGCVIHQVRAVTEDAPLDVNSLFPTKTP
jgi:hypothetical protein